MSESAPPINAEQLGNAIRRRNQAICRTDDLELPYGMERVVEPPPPPPAPPPIDPATVRVPQVGDRVSIRYPTDRCAGAGAIAHGKFFRCDAYDATVTAVHTDGNKYPIIDVSVATPIRIVNPIQATRSDTGRSILGKWYPATDTSHPAYQSGDFIPFVPSRGFSCKDSHVAFDLRGVLPEIPLRQGAKVAFFALTPKGEAASFPARIVSDDHDPEFAIEHIEYEDKRGIRFSYGENHPGWCWPANPSPEATPAEDDDDGTEPFHAPLRRDAERYADELFAEPTAS